LSDHGQSIVSTASSWSVPTGKGSADRDMLRPQIGFQRFAPSPHRPWFRPCLIRTCDRRSNGSRYRAARDRPA